MAERANAVDSTRPFLIDSHAHLELEPLVKEPDEVISRASRAGVRAIITVGIDLEDVKTALEVANRFEHVYACVGFHPHNAKTVTDNALAEMERLARGPKVVGYGEVGLDFFRNLSPREVQIQAFRDQLTIAKRLGKPVVIHLRNAYPEGVKILEAAAPFPAGGVIHCFSGEMQDARRCLDLGFYVSIPGTITYKKNEKLRSIVRDLPEDRILLETDCPFLAPEPLRGKDNEPAYIVHTANKVAEVRGSRVQDVATVTSKNAVKLFRLPCVTCTESLG
jgi:TatD DNase family protein